MPRLSFLETAYDQSKDAWRETFRADQLKIGGGSDPFSETPAPIQVNAFEVMPGALIRDAFTNLRLRLPHGSVQIVLKRPSVDQRQGGAPDKLASTSPEWWIGHAIGAGLPVRHYTVNLEADELCFSW